MAIKKIKHMRTAFSKSAKGWKQEKLFLAFFLLRIITETIAYGINKMFLVLIQ